MGQRVRHLAHTLHEAIVIASIVIGIVLTNAGFILNLWEAIHGQ